MNTQIQTYLDWKAFHAPRASINYRIWLERLFEYCKKSLEGIGIEDVTRFQIHIGTKYASPTTALAMTAVKNFFKFWKLQGKPVIAPELIKLPKAHNRMMCYLTEDEYRTIVPHLRWDTYRETMKSIAFELLYLSGMRLSELVDLDLSSLDTARKKGIIRNRKNARYRIFVWDEKFHKRLSYYLGIRLCENQGSALFPARLHTKAVDRISTRTIQHWVHELCTRAGIQKKITPHSLRHGKAHFMLDHGADMPTIKTQLGHSNPQSTFVYTQFNDPDFEKKARRYL